MEGSKSCLLIRIVKSDRPPDVVLHIPVIPQEWRQEN
jgi:hypothetical protein